MEKAGWVARAKFWGRKQNEWQIKIHRLTGEKDHANQQLKEARSKLQLLNKQVLKLKSEKELFAKERTRFREAERFFNQIRGGPCPKLGMDCKSKMMQSFNQINALEREVVAAQAELKMLYTESEEWASERRELLQEQRRNHEELRELRKYEVEYDQESGHWLQERQDIELRVVAANKAVEQKNEELVQQVEAAREELAAAQAENLALKNSSQEAEDFFSKTMQAMKESQQALKEEHLNLQGQHSLLHSKLGVAEVEHSLL